MNALALSSTLPRTRAQVRPKREPVRVGQHLQPRHQRLRARLDHCQATVTGVLNLTLNMTATLALILTLALTCPKDLQRRP